MNKTESTSKKDRKSRRGRNKVLKIVRRTHMYTGLILLPWVILFGLSGMLFNHAETFGPIEVVSEFSDQELADSHSFDLPSADQMANEVIEGLNAKQPNQFSLASSQVIYEGAFSFEGASDSEKATAIISPNGHGAKVRQVEESGIDQERPDFDGETIQVGSFDAASVEHAARSLFESAGISDVSSLEPSRRGGVEMRFQVDSAEDGKRWNVVYNLGTGGITARSADSPIGMSPYALLTRLHKTHHYPDRVGARWFWTLIADATAITMVFWGISGLAMWWQMKPSRVIGLGGLAVAVVLAGVVFSGTISSYTFGPAQQRSSGGPPAGGGGKRGGKGSPERRDTTPPVSPANDHKASSPTAQTL